jgi:hypothetical protein
MKSSMLNTNKLIANDVVRCRRTYIVGESAPSPV